MCRLKPLILAISKQDPNIRLYMKRMFIVKSI